MGIWPHRMHSLSLSWGSSEWLGLRVRNKVQQLWHKQNFLQQWQYGGNSGRDSLRHFITGQDSITYTLTSVSGYTISYCISISYSQKNSRLQLTATTAAVLSWCAWRDWLLIGSRGGSLLSINGLGFQKCKLNDWQQKVKSVLDARAAWTCLHVEICDERSYRVRQALQHIISILHYVWIVVYENSEWTTLP